MTLPVEHNNENTASRTNRKVPIVEIILSSHRPPRNRNLASLLKCFGEFLKLSPVAVPEEQSPFMLRSLCSPHSLSYFPSSWPFTLNLSWHLFCGALNHPVSHRLAWYINAVHSSGRKQASCTDRQSCMYGFYTSLICSRGMRAHNWSFILSTKWGKCFFYVVAVKLKFKSLLSIIQTSLFLPLSSTACLSFFLLQLSWLCASTWFEGWVGVTTQQLKI